MKNRIRLGISSVSNRLKNSANSIKNTMSISEIAFDNIPSFTGKFSSVSATDLDEMFNENLKLLNELEKDELSSNTNNKSQRYQSSLNIYLAPQKNWRHSIGMYYSNCDIMPFCKLEKKNHRDINKSQLESKSSQLTKSPLFSSYETLYDNLKLKNNDNNYKNFEIMSQSMMDTSSRSINEVLEINGNKSSDSDRTLKSLTSDDNDDSSSVSSIESQENPKEMCFKNYKTSIVYLRNVYQSSCDALKFKPTTSVIPSRPSSCYVDSSFGQYTTRSNSIGIKNHNRVDKSNLVISKPLGHYPSRSNFDYFSVHNSGNSNSNTNFQSDGSSVKIESKQLIKINDKQYMSIKDPQYASTNILNNHFVPYNNNLPVNITKSYNNISNNDGKCNLKAQRNRHSYNCNNEEADIRKQVKVISVDQNKRTNNSVSKAKNFKNTNTNVADFSIQLTGHGGKNVSNEENFISTSKCCQIRRTSKA